MDTWPAEHDSESPGLRAAGLGRLADRFGRAWQEAVWDDDLRATKEEDVFWRPHI